MSPVIEPSHPDCGLDKGYQRHKREKTPACRPCLDAHLAYERQRIARGPAPHVLAPCGSPAAWRRHKRRDEQPCEACVRAHRAEVARNYRARRGAA